MRNNIFAVALVLFNSAYGFASDLYLNTQILPTALQMPAVKNFIDSNSHDLRTAGVSGRYSCGGVGFPQCGVSAKGQPNGYFTMRLTFDEPANAPTYQ